MSRNPNDAADRSAYRRYVVDRVDGNLSPSFGFLAGREQGKFHDARPGQMIGGTFYPSDKAGAYSDRVAGGRFTELQWQAGHAARDDKGTNYLAIEDATTNMRDGAKYEKHYDLEKRTVAIEGLAINEGYARRLEADGFLKPSTVDAAPSVRGWTKEHGIIGPDGKPLADHTPKPERAEEKQQQSEHPQPSPLAGAVTALGTRAVVREMRPNPSRMAREVGPKASDAIASPVKEPDPPVQ